MKLRWKRGQAIIALLCVVLMLFVAACGSGDDDDSDDNGNSTPTTSAATATTGSSESDTTATTADDEDEAQATGTDTASGAATATEGDDDDGTATGTSGSDATATDSSATKPAATEPSGTSTAPTTSNATATTGSGNGSNATPTESTGSASPTGDVGLEVPEVETLDPELLPNFSMRMNFDATNFTGTPETSLVIELQQSEVGTFHMLMETDGEGLEFWTIGEQSWTSVGGQIIESPVGSMFDPADILTTGELIPDGLEARRDGKETINGRETTRWVTDGADYVRFMNEQTKAQGITTIEMTDGEGEVVIWIDDELNIMIKADGDVTWTNSDSTNGSLVYQYEIHDIGSTPAITEPQ